MKIFIRTITAIVTAAAVVCALLFLPTSIIKPGIILLAALVHLEFSQMVAKKYPIMVAQGVAAGILFLVSKHYFFDSCFVPLMFALALFALFSKTSHPIAAWATTVLGFFYVPVMVDYFLCLLTKPSFEFITPLLYILAIVKISDMGGFAFGIAFGKHKMCPSISPGKSWEGMAGSIFASCLTSCAFMPLTGYTWSKALAFGVAAAVCGTLGDLVESRIKRECDMKDSSTFMPAGMGGFLDMFDSIIFTPALLYPFV